MERYCERRRDVRVQVRYPVTVHAAGMKRHGRTVDLSCGGARIAPLGANAGVPTGPVRVVVDTGDGDLELLGVSVWQARGSYGVRFLIMSDVERLTLAELLDGERAA